MLNRRTIKLSKPHPTQELILAQRKRFNVCCLGRRAGKTNLAIHLIVDEALRGGFVGVFAPV